MAGRSSVASKHCRIPGDSPPLVLETDPSQDRTRKEISNLGMEDWLNKEKQRSKLLGAFPSGKHIIGSIFKMIK